MDCFLSWNSTKKPLLLFLEVLQLQIGEQNPSNLFTDNSISGYSKYVLAGKYKHAKSEYTEIILFKLLLLLLYPTYFEEIIFTKINLMLSPGELILQERSRCPIIS